MQSGNNSRPTRPVVTFNSIWSRLRNAVGERLEEFGQILLGDPLEPGLVGGRVDAEASVHALSPAGLYAVIAGLVGAGDYKHVSLEIRGDPQLFTGWGRKNVGGELLRGPQVQHGGLASEVIESLFARAH